MHYQHTLKFASKSYFHNFFYVSQNTAANKGYCLSGKKCKISFSP